MPLHGPLIIRDARPKIVDTLLTLNLRGGSDIGTIIFAQKGGQYYDYECMQLPGPRNMHDARPKIIEAPLTLIFRRW